MNNIGLTFDEMSKTHAKYLRETLENFDDVIAASVAQYLTGGFSEDEASFRAENSAQITASATAILATIAENNHRILTNLKEAGLLTG
ncbi:hypothetical protein ACFLVL_03005 [Chloroflexota bacterium]